MPDIKFANQSSNFDATSNWGGATIATTDTLRIYQGDLDITGNMNQSAINLALLDIGPGFRGRIGSPGDPLYIDADEIRINAPLARGIHIRPVSTPLFTVNGANMAEAGVYIPQGNITKLVASAAMMLRIGAATIGEIIGVRSNAYAGNELNIVIDSGASLTTGKIQGANLRSLSTFGTSLKVDRSKVDWRTTGTLPLLDMQSGSIFEWNGASTLTLANVWGGTLDATRIQDTRVLTDSEVWQGGVIDLGAAASALAVTVTNNIKKYGGKVFGTNKVTIYAEAASDSLPNFSGA